MTLAEQIEELKTRYPDPRSAIMPALRLAQERDGWLSRSALEEVADAVGVTPAYASSIATFYDMFHTRPVGTHLVEVCTNICCALRGAQRVLAAFEDELGIRAGETTEDDEVTLRAVECLGACGWPTAIAVDHVQRNSVSADDVPEILRGVRSG